MRIYVFAFELLSHNVFCLNHYRRINDFCKNLALSTLQLRSDRSLTYTFLSHSERLVLLVFPKKSKEGNESCAYSTSINIHTHIYVSSSAHLKLKRTFLKNWSSAVCCPVWCAVEMLSRAWPCYANHHHSCESLQSSQRRAAWRERSFSWVTLEELCCILVAAF